MPGPIELSVVVPAYNEIERLERTVVEIVQYLRTRGTTFEIVVSDDGSSDGTDELVATLGDSYCEVRLLRHHLNRGKGYAVRAGLHVATGDRVLFCDADGATPFGEIEALEQALDSGADVAVGSRAAPSSEVERVTLLHRRVMGRVFSALVTARLAPGISDTQCGFKLFTNEAAAVISQRLSVPGYGFDLEIFVIARRSGLRVAEIPVNWHEVGGSKVRLIGDSLQMVLDAVRVGSRDRAGSYLTEQR